MGPIASFEAHDSEFFQVPFENLKGSTMVSKPSGLWALVFALREIYETYCKFFLIILNPFYMLKGLNSSIRAK